MLNTVCLGALFIGLAYYFKALRIKHVVIIFAVFILCNIYLYNNNYHADYFHRNYFGSVLLFGVTSISGSIITMYLAFKIPFRIIYIEWIGKNSLYFYIIHYFVLDIITSFIDTLSFMNLLFVFFICIGLTSLIVLIINFLFFHKKVYKDKGII